jgi:hypothetical protein
LGDGSGGEVLLLLAGLLVEAGVGEAGPDGQVQVELVAQPVRDDGVGGDVGVVAVSQVAVAAGQRRAGGMGWPSGRVNAKAPPAAGVISQPQACTITWCASHYADLLVMPL